MSARKVAVCGARSARIEKALGAQFAASDGAWQIADWGDFDSHAGDSEAEAEVVVAVFDYEESSCRVAAARAREWRGQGRRVILTPFPIDFAFGFLPDLRRRAAQILATENGASAPPDLRRREIDRDLRLALRRREIDRDLRLADGDDFAPALAREIAAPAAAPAVSDSSARFLPVAELIRMLGFRGARIDPFCAAAGLPPPADDFAAGIEPFAAWLADNRWLPDETLLQACEYGFTLAHAARALDRAAVASCGRFHYALNYSFFYPREIELAAQTLNNLLWAETAACGGRAPRRVTLLLAGAFTYSEDMAGQALKAAAVSVLAAAGDSDAAAYRIEYLDSLPPEVRAMFPRARESESAESAESTTGKKIADLRAKIGDVL